MTDHWTVRHATVAELRAILGDRWAICRNTPKNRQRYGRCITRQEYARIVARILAGRGK